MVERRALVLLLKLNPYQSPYFSEYSKTWWILLKGVIPEAGLEVVVDRATLRIDDATSLLSLPLLILV